MDKTLQLKIITALQDRLSAPLKKIIGATGQTAQSLKGLRDRLKGLEGTQRSVGQFRELSRGLRDTNAKMQEARERVSKLAREMRNTEAPTGAMRREFDQAVKAAQRLKVVSQEQSQKLQDLRTKLSGAGISTKSLVSHERSLRESIHAANGAIKEQISKLDAVAARQKRIASARKAMHDTQGVAANMAIAGYATRTAGKRVLGGLGNTLGESKMVENESLRIRALGLGDESAADAVKYARGLHQRGTSKSDNVQLMRDAMTIFADEHHAQMVLPTLAKMKYANEAVYGAKDAHANEEKFLNMLKVIELRGGTKDKPSFDKEANMVQKVLTATGGRVGGDEWREFIQRGGVAAKQMRDDAFYYQMEPLIQEMGGHQAGTGLMSAYSNLYQGKTTVRAVGEMMKYGLVNPDMVEYTKIGTVKRVKPGALVGGQLFKASPLEWIEQVLLPKLAAKGVTDRGGINDAISSMITNRTGANLFATMVMQAQQIHKNERLNTGADDINALAAKASGSTQGREVELLAKVRDLKLELGEKVSPLYNAALEKTAALTGSIVDFMREHATVAKVLIAALVILGGVLAVGGTLGIALASILGPMALIKFSLTTLGVQSGIASVALTKLGTVFTFIGRLIALNPIGAAIMAIAIAAFLIWKYWEPIKGFFLGLWEEVKRAFDGGLSGIVQLILNWSPLGFFYKAFAGVMSYFGVELPGKFTEFGSMLVSGLITGISNMAGALKDSVLGMGSSAVGWFKEKLGINSPSRVFMGFGENISEGTAQGISRTQGLAARAAGILAAGVVSAGAVSPAFGRDMPTVKFDRRPSISAQAAGMGPTAAAGSMAGLTLAGDHIEIHIHAAPGQSPEDLARAVSAELDRRERNKMARIRSSLADYGD